MQAEVLRAKVAALRAAYDEVAACAIDTLTHAELLPEMDELEALALPTAHPTPPHAGPAASPNHPTGTGRQVVAGGAR